VNKLGILTAISCGLSLAVVAAPINGTFGGNGWATVSFSNLNFCPTGVTPNGANQAGACTPGTGNIALSGGALSFANVSGNLNQIKSLSQANQPVGSTSGPGLPLPSWMVFTPEAVPVGGPQISLTLTEVLAGTFPNSPNCDPFGVVAAGQTCTPAGSAFNLQNQTTTSSSATFTILGNAVDGVPADTAPFQIIFTGQFTVPYQVLLQALLTNGGTGNYSGSYSVSFSTISGVPEPGTLSLIGAGLIGLGFIRRKRS